METDNYRTVFVEVNVPFLLTLEVSDASTDKELDAVYYEIRELHGRAGVASSEAEAVEHVKRLAGSSLRAEILDQLE